MSYQHQRTIRGLDLNGANALDARETCPDAWLAWDAERSRGLASYTWQQMVSRIAELLTEGWVRRLEPGPGLEQVYPDQAGGLWRGGIYLPAVLWLPSVIPPYPPQDQRHAHPVAV